MENHAQNSSHRQDIPSLPKLSPPSESGHKFMESSQLYRSSSSDSYHSFREDKKKAKEGTKRPEKIKVHKTQKTHKKPSSSSRSSSSSGGRSHDHHHKRSSKASPSSGIRSHEQQHKRSSKTSPESLENNLKLLSISTLREAMKPYLEKDEDEDEDFGNEKIFTRLQLTIEQFREGIIGRNVLFESPFGGKIITLYADDTASGRPHDIVENYIRSILPIYANTHSDNSYFPVSMHLIYKDSIRYLKKIFNTPKHFELLGVGTGSTGAIFRFQEILMQKYSKRFVDPQNPPVCFVTQYEHHSNILSWQKFGFKIIPIEHTFRHHWDKGVKDLAEKLESSVNCPLVVISVSAASNVTSQKTPLKMVSEVFQSFKAKHNNVPIVFSVDMAAYAPHARIDMAALKIDAIFISPHKLTGGPGSCGILIFNTEHYERQSPPTHPAGGTVSLVIGYEPSEVQFVADVFERESDGTPGILQLIRAKEAFALQDKIGLEYIENRENELKEMVFYSVAKMNEKWKKKGIGCHIDIIGTQRLEERSSVFSILMFDREGEIYHYHLMQRILNDIFGVQLRSGCNCAGPFGVKLLERAFNLKENLTFLVEEIKSGKTSKHKPGWVRFNVHYSFSNQDMKYLLFALRFTTKNGASIFQKYYEEVDGEYRISQHNDFNDALNELTASSVKRMEIREVKESKRNLYLKKTMKAVKKFVSKNKVKNH